MSAVATSDPGAEEASSGYKWRVLISVVFGLFMVILDTTVVNVAFRTLQGEFSANVNDSQWIISVYVMALGISTPLAGFLADRFGIKRIFVGGLAVFTFGSLLCGVAPSLWLLIAARGLQGAGGGIALPLGTAILFATFAPEERGKALGFFGIALVLAPTLGPIMGGWLVDHNLWRWIFFLNVPIGGIGVFLGSRWLRERRSERQPAFDPLGLLTSTVGFGTVLYAASVAADKGWTSTTVVTCFAVGAVVLVAFALVELFVAPEPLLDLRLFKEPTFALSCLIGWVSVIALFGAEFLLPLYLQVLRGRTALEAGLLLLPLALTAGVATPLAGVLYDKIGARPLLVTGFALLSLNTWQLSQLQVDTSLRWLGVLLAMRGAALGLTVQTTFVIALSVVPPRLTARGSSLVNSTRQVVQSIGVAVLATVLASSLTPGLSTQLQAFQQSIPTQSGGDRVELCTIATLPATVPPQARALIEQFCGEYIVGLHDAYHITFFAALLAILIGATLPGWPLRWEGRKAQAGEATGH